MATPDNERQVMDTGNQMTGGYISDRLCDNCEAPLIRHVKWSGDDQYDNALVIAVDGGYGMFVESKGFGGPEGVIIFCHECAHKLCDLFPGFKEYIDPELSHTHTGQYKEANPNHERFE